MTQSAYWKKTALDSIPDPQQHVYVVGSIVVGTMIAGASTVLSGGLFTLLGILYSYRRGEKAGKFDEAIEQHGVIAPALRKQALIDYVAEVGIVQAITEIRWAEENGFPTSDDAIELLESSGLDSAIPLVQSGTQITTIPTLPQNRLGLALAPPLAPNLPATSNIRNLVERIVSKPEHLLGIGASESGKGILFSNMAVALKARCDCSLVVIDPKGDPNEVKFFDGVADRVHRFRSSRLTPDEIIAEVKEGWAIVEAEFDRWAGIKPVYVFIDEMVFIGIQFSQKRDNFLNDKISAIVTMGKSLQQFVWIATQYPGIEELGIKGGVAAQMTKIIIGRDEHLEMLEGWRGYKLTKDIDFKGAIAPMRKSPVKRAIWFKGEWIPMEIMPILSGFCRETGKHVGGRSSAVLPLDTIASAITPEVAEVPPSRRSAAESPTSAGASDIPASPSRLGDELPESILEYFRCVVVPQPKKLTDIKGASRFKNSSFKDEELIEALAVLVKTERLEAPMPGFWASPAWAIPS